jgi:hypothetical protein
MRITRCKGGTISWGIIVLVFLLTSQLSAIGFAQSGGLITTVVGNGTAGFSGDGDRATSAQVRGPVGMAFDSEGSLYFADSENHRIRKVTRDGYISTMAGNGTAGYGGDGGPATSAQLDYPEGIAFDSAGNLYIADFYNSHVRKVTPKGVISTVANIFAAYDLAFDKGGNLYVAQAVTWDDSSRVYKITPAGQQSVVAGGVESTIPPREGEDAASVCLSDVSGIAIDSAGDLLIATPAWERILKVTPDGKIHIVAGGGNQGLGDGGPAIAAQLTPSGLAVDAQGIIYAGDLGSYSRTTRALIRKVTPDGIISTIAGKGTIGYSGDGGPAISAELASPADVALDSSGNLYIADYGNQRIRKVASPSPSYFPQLALGGGWSALFTFTNTGSAEASGNLILRDSRGNPFLVRGQWSDTRGTENAANPGSSFTFSIPPGGSISLLATAADLSDTKKTGWAQLETTGNSIAGMATFEHAVGLKTDSMVIIPHSTPIQLGVIPVDIDSSSGKQLAYAIANPGAQAISINLVLIAQDGTVVNDSVAVNLGPGGQIARYLLQDLRLDKFKGSLVLRGQNGQTFVAIGLLDKQGLFAAISLVKSE